MPKVGRKAEEVCLDALCGSDRHAFPMAISELTCEGCSAEAPADWDGDLDFLHLRIADRIDINGRVLWRNGRRIKIGFFGQLHPLAIDDLFRAAA